jgi:hypothetical protein
MSANRSYSIESDPIIGVEFIPVGGVAGSKRPSGAASVGD